MDKKCFLTVKSLLNLFTSFIVWKRSAFADGTKVRPFDRRSISSLDRIVAERLIRVGRGFFLVISYVVFFFPLVINIMNTFVSFIFFSLYYYYLHCLLFVYSNYLNISNVFYGYCDKPQWHCRLPQLSCVRIPSLT